MHKFITATLVAATTAAALSACNVDTSSNAKGNHQGRHHASGTNAKAVDASTTKSKPSYTVAQENAIESAQTYLSMGGFSRSGLIQQLSSKAGDGFKLSDATFAVDHVRVNWNKQALQSAKSYLDMSGFSRAGLLEQLTSKAGDQFTKAQATYAVNHVGL